MVHAAAEDRRFLLPALQKVIGWGCVGSGDQRYGHGSSFSVVVSQVAAAPEEAAGIPDRGSSG
jgi:hypothetical protein